MTTWFRVKAHRLTWTRRWRSSSRFSGRLFGIAYRMLGSRTEAEDIVYDVWLRWQNYDRSTVIDPAAFLATTTRLCINALQSARARRETYIGA